MSQLPQSNEDNHPEAARKHFEDARVLLDGERADGAAYLSGYVVECALKSILLRAKKGAIMSHDLKGLRIKASSVLRHIEGGWARYITEAIKELDSSEISKYWKPEMRYQKPNMTIGQAREWFTEAQNLYEETVYKMVLDGTTR